MTYKDVSEELKIPLPTLYSMVSRHQIPHFRLGPRFVRFRREDLEQWMQQRQVAVGMELDPVSLVP